MRRGFVLIGVLSLFFSYIQGIAIQKIIRPKTVSIMAEKVPQAGMGIKVDINVIEGHGIYVATGMKNNLSQQVELVDSFQKNIEASQAGEFELRIINESDDYANISVSIYADSAHEDTDEAEVLKKLLDKVRVDLMNIYNDILKLKNANTHSLVKTKSAKNTLWVVCVFPLLYIFLSYWRLQSIKSFFSTKKRNKI
ncbi:hypothetical protein NEPAR06_1923 [Nematocida parisii]|uniref:GOLD domain-containing protein n=1 Tax=Nematocida parisii (strain ERTm3) TaxID=935791 RepID=I3EF38_NEMP3|nr:uncharacterized protein NEPG_02012 [Nematocida parisii ERTm1]EIJ87835.1 hypothetical protein NEQG_01907 [Nematocida parisii ERTm3]KAI5129260.1 hypothetical protein NEPAR03_1621 [Nematocida parisii]EIJ93056.1 hypothetical protein NEPG_02012 [Nematocida parisii ERTm1]KAI5129438.1 hypothetical protein NEPAR08_1588 [Nematocida parisii]KAI5141993.1 hypothetical protein NEPAR04_1349 [Nematocida parisii]|eukprot:XP_013059839.1 hypothetical protein NEPG_02012 [Nematocida parisii ERTm1]